MEEAGNDPPKRYIHENDEAAERKHRRRVVWNTEEPDQIPNLRYMDSVDQQPPVEKTVMFSGKSQVTFKSRR